MLTSMAHARVSGARLTPASLATHVITFCGDAGCRGHRTPRKPAPIAVDPAPMASPRPASKPMGAARRTDVYLAQMGGRGLTARQGRQIARQAARAGEEW